MSRDSYAIVFQMGKVASTAITSALDSLPGVEAVQSHFLGETALSRILQSAIGPDNNDYFFRHQLGQLTQNITATRNINRILHGRDPRRLVMLSLTREPFSWFRSSIVQDIEGYGDMLANLAPEDIADQARSARIGAGLSRFLGMIADRISEKPTVEGYLNGLRRRDPGAWDSIAQWPHEQRHLLMTAMRPADWFRQHFTGATGLKISDLERDGDVWRLERDGQIYAILRYEDIPTAFPDFCTWAFGTVPKLPVSNESSGKDMSDVIADAFTSPEAQRLREVLLRCEYARIFDYD